VVENTGTTLRADAYRPVNLPEPVQVKEDTEGNPAVIRLLKRQKVISIEDCWRIDDEWWRREPVSRLYHTVRLASGQRLMVFKDLITGSWYRQSY
jgi:hypothetical protein